jgi:hypothetical protein
LLVRFVNCKTWIWLLLLLKVFFFQLGLTLEG